MLSKAPVVERVAAGGVPHDGGECRVAEEGLQRQSRLGAKPSAIERVEQADTVPGEGVVERLFGEVTFNSVVGRQRDGTHSGDAEGIAGQEWMQVAHCRVELGEGLRRSPDAETAAISAGDLQNGAEVKVVAVGVCDKKVGNVRGRSVNIGETAQNTRSGVKEAGGVEKGAGALAGTDR